MTIFHILDSIAQDIRIENETADAREIRPLGDEEEDDDPEVQSRRRSAAKKPTISTGGYGRLRMIIHLFGTTADGKSLRASVEGFRPFFFVRLPDAKKTTRATFEAALGATIKDRAYNLKGCVDVSYESRKVLYGYSGGALFPFARLTVDSLAAFRALKKLFLHPETSTPVFNLNGVDLKVYEANLDPMLRFFHLRDIKPCGWVETDAELDAGAAGTYTLDTDWEDIRPSEGPTASAPFLLAAWDIECYSENGEFPLAKKTFDRLAKQIYAGARDPEHAAELIVQAAVFPEAPPAGMDPLRRRDDKPATREQLEAALLKPDVLDTMRPLLTKREGLSVSSKEDRVVTLRALLGRALARALPLAGDPVIQIGVVLVRAGSPTQKHIFVLGTCGAVDGATVHAYKTEREMILGWARAMATWNPDILVGYNVFGFDEKYLWQRAQELKITEDPHLQSLTRLGDMEKTLDLEEKFLSSSALGDNTMYIWSAHGRLQIDLFHYIKRSFSLPAYKLDYVCQHFMSGKLSGVDCGEPGAATWCLKTKSTGDVVVGRYVTLLDETGDAVAEKLRVVEITANAGLVVEAPTGDDAEDLRAATPDAVKWAMVKDDVSPQDIFRLQRGTAEDRAKVAAYCVQDCDLVVELYKKLDVFNNAMAMANACSVPVGYIFTRGQGIKIESLIFKECFRPERNQAIVVLPTQPRRPAESAGGAEEGAVPAAVEESYEGAIVLTPRPGFYFESPVGVADFASLYPSTIISENISHDTLLWVKDYDLAGNFVGSPAGFEERPAVPAGTGPGHAVAWTEIEFDIWGVKEGDTRKNPEKVKKGLRVCRYAQFAGDAKGTLPDIVQQLLAARKTKRKEAEKESDPFKKALLDAEQLAYKLTANSLYGQLGSPTFKVRLQHLAASVTAYGRKQIMFAKAAIEQFYGPAAGDPSCSAETVYGDTDSLFINFNVRDPVTGERLKGKDAIVATMALTEEAGKLVTTCLKPPHDFEYDKVFSPFIIFSKKRYVGNKYEESPDDYYQNSMGIATKRRDYAGIVKVIYGGAIRILLTEQDPVGAAGFVKDKLMDLAEGRASTTQLTMTKSLRAEYRSLVPPAHKILAERIAARDPGNAPASGDRISFLYVLPTPGQPAAKSQGDRIETPGWIKEHKLEIDAKFYMEHQLMNPISQLFALTVENLPGAVPPKGKTWETAESSDREYAAAEWLFRDALNACDRDAKRRFGQRFFGAAAAAGQAEPAVEAPGLRRSARRSPPPPLPAKMQTTLTSLFMQQQLIKELEKGSKKKSPPTSSATQPPATQKGKGRGNKKAAGVQGTTIDI